MPSIRVRALIPFLACASGAAACLDADMVPTSDIAGQTQEISTEVFRDQNYAVILIDRTGSMMNLRDNGNTRCHDAVWQARTDAERFFRDREGLGVAFWLFNRSIGIQQVGSGYYTNMTQVDNALATINREGCPLNASTPLADALCRVASGFADGKPALSPLPGAMYVETDGQENASQGSCGGPSGDVYTSGTWQNRVFYTLFPNGIKVYTQYWLDDELIGQLGDDGDIDVETGKPVPEIVTSSACGSLTACESALFDELAFWTGGLYGVVVDSDLDYSCTYSTCPAPKPPQ